MFLIKTKVKDSETHGLGVFTEEKVTKGNLVWKYDPIIDILFDPKDVEGMSLAHQELIRRYAFLSKKSGKYVYSIDNSQFVNHSRTRANIINVEDPEESELQTVAVRDIEAGEELLIDYRALDAADATSSKSYLNS